MCDPSASRSLKPISGEAVGEMTPGPALGVKSVQASELYRPHSRGNCMTSGIADAPQREVPSSGRLPTAELRLNTIARTALNSAARLWFVVAVLGQWMMAFYVAAFYGGSALRGDIEAWSKVLPRGYVAGDTTGNAVVAMHLFLAVIVFVGGPLQIIPQVRARLPRFHRWNGRLYLLAAVATSLGGLYMLWIRGGAVGDVSQHIGISLNAVAIVLCAVMAWRYAVARDLVAHRRWALRLFLVVPGVWFFRIGLMLWLVLNQGPVGFDPKSFEGPFLTFLSFAQYLLPLAVLELYLRTKARAGARGQLAMAGSLFVLTLAMGVGIVAATMGMWLPRL